MERKKGRQTSLTRRFHRARGRLMLAGLRFGLRIGGYWLPAPTIRFAYHFWFTPRRFATPLRELCYEETATIEYLNHDGVPLATYRWGEGPAVLLVHGWSGRATQLHAFVNPLLQAGYQVVAMDAPAHGRTQGKKTNVFEYVAALAKVQDRFGPFNGAIAHSFGNPAVMLALQEGVLDVGHVVAVSSPSNLIGMLYKYAAMLDLPDNVTEGLRLRAEQEFGEDLWHRMTVETVAPNLRTPALIIHDENDTDVPIEEGETTAAHWPGAKMLRTRGLGHTRILRANAVVEAAVAFIDDLDLDTGEITGPDDQNKPRRGSIPRPTTDTGAKSPEPELIRS